MKVELSPVHRKTNGRTSAFVCVIVLLLLVIVFFSVFIIPDYVKRGDTTERDERTEDIGDKAKESDIPKYKDEETDKDKNKDTEMATDKYTETNKDISGGSGENSGSSRGKIKTRVYDNTSDGAFAIRVSITYREDLSSSDGGEVSSLSGSISLPVDGNEKFINSCKSDSEMLKNRAGYENFKIDVYESGHSCNVTFSFPDLNSDGREAAAMYAAEFISCSVKNGKLHINEASKSLENIGYTLSREY